MVNILTIVLIGLAAGTASVSLLVADSAVLTITTSLLVLAIIATSAILSARLVGYVINRVVRKN